MKKTVTININNAVFHIEEDAYNELEKYFETLKAHFLGQEGADEIVSDMEARAGEHFNQRIRFGMSVITLLDVAEVITIMGKPEEIEQESQPEPKAQESTTESTPIPEPQPGKKRFYRNPDNKILGGVLGGLSLYADIDVVLLRILALLLTIPFFGSTLWIYILLWILIPEADTPTKQLEMRGSAINLDNIQKILQERKEPIEKIGHMILKAIGIFIKVIFTLVVAFLGFIFITVMLALVTTLVAMIGSSVAIASLLPLNFAPLLTHVGPTHIGIGIAALIFLLGIPLYSIIRVTLRWVFNLKKQATWATIVLLLLWFMSLITCTVLAGLSIPDLIYLLP